MSIRKGDLIISGNGGAGGGSAMNVDDVTTSLNTHSEIQAIGVIEKNKSEPKYDWVGTYEEWIIGRNNSTIDDDWICYIIDDEGSGSKVSKERTLGEIIYSLIPISDPSLHLLDGSLIDGTGVYNQFYTYMKNLYENGYDKCFTTEEIWQASDAAYNACGKFVLDTSNQTIRLPEVQGFVEGTLDEAAIGELVEAGLPNITGSTNEYKVRTSNVSVSPSGQGTGALKYSNDSSKGGATGSASYDVSLTFDASNSNSIYGNSNTVQPQAIKGFYYIVLATSVNMEVSMDMDALVNDVNKKADKDLINTGYLTNCITEIPQDIKLELSNGILTLKAGSKLYYPNGFEQDGTTPKFDTEILSSDLTLTSTNNDTWCIFVRSSGSLGGRGLASQTGSGTTTPSSGYCLYYNTAENFVKDINAGSVYDEKCTLPIAIITATTSGISEIKQVFNGFGYIGKVNFALPGVKCLIPDGRNADGSLKNIYKELSKVCVTEKTGNWSQTQCQFITDEETPLAGNGNLDAYAASDYYYNEEENYIYFLDTGNSGAGKCRRKNCLYALELLTSGVISEFKSKQVYQPVDYSGADYVIETQAPTSTNNYTWYRKYKSGWVEQGGTFYQNQTATSTVNLLVTMLDNYYSIMLQRMNNSNSYELAITSTTTTSFSTGTTAAGGDYKWRVEGMSAQS